LISSFGQAAGGERNDGINIAAPRGTPVRAAGAGTVTYVGNELKGYGNLVLIRHDNGYVTAYAHSDTVTVSRGDRVARGQIIAYSGATGDVNQPQVHFELRVNTKPVDPVPYLAATTS
jgi:murein DD-endopeptidase MepM/ murein hydrolase activator NlpD